MPPFSPSPLARSWSAPARGASPAAGPRSAAACRRAAWQAADRNALDEACELLAEAVALRPQDSVLRLTWALHLEKAGRLQDCARVCRGLDPERSPAAAHLLARLADEQGASEPSIAAWTKHLKRFPADIHCRLGLARTLREAGDWGGAQTQLDVVCRQDKLSAEGLQEQVSLHLELGEVGKATRPLRRLRRLTQDGPRALPSLARVQLAMGAPTAARRAVEHLPSPSPLLEAEIALARGEHEHAWEALDAAGPGPERAEIQAQITLFRGNADKARELVTEALAGPASTARRARLLHLLGEIEDRADRPAAAATAWRAANYTWGPPGTARVDCDRMREIMGAMDNHSMQWMPRRETGGEGVLLVVGAPGSGVRLCASILGGDPKLRLRVPSVRLRDLPGLMRRAGSRPWLQSLHRMHPSELDHLAQRYLGKQTGDTVLVDGDVDALPYLGLLNMLLPRARVVVMQRDPQDQLLSLWRRPHPQTNRSWSRSPAATRRWLRCHREMVDHWASQLPGMVTRVQYEELLQDPDGALQDIRRSLGRPAPELPAAACVRPLTSGGPVLALRSIGRGSKYLTWTGRA